MNRYHILYGAVALMLLLAAVAGLTHAQGPGPQENAAPQAPLGTTFTYQGQLKSDDELINDDCSMAFRLYDEAEYGSQVGPPITLTVPITDGLFTVGLDFGGDAFSGDARWLGIRVKCSTDDDYANLGRQELTAAPYALYARSTGALQGHPVTTTLPAEGQVLEWNGGAWVPATDDDTTYTAGTGLALTGTEFSITTTYRLPQACINGQITEWNGSAWACGSDDVGADGIAWSLSGNAGTIPGTHFLGTIDGVSLTLAVSNTPALRLEPSGVAPNLIGGCGGNRVTAGVWGPPSVAAGTAPTLTR